MLLGIDIGTTGTKATLHTLDGRVVGQGYSEYEVNYLQPQWAEQDPKSWIVAMKRSISQTFKQFQEGEESLTGICVSGQSPTLVAVDAKGEPVYPAMIWLDNRAKKEYQEVIAKNSLESLYGLMGIRPSPSTIFPKILWLKKHRKEAYAHARWYHQTKDYIVNQLTGVRVTDVIHAQGYLCFDLQNQKTDFSIYDQFDVDPSHVPEFQSCDSIVGETTLSANKFGIPSGIPVINGSIDAVMAIVGNGVLKPNITCEISGTSTVINMTSEKLVLDPLQRYMINRHPLGNMWLIASMSSTSGAILKWFRDNIWAMMQTHEDKRQDPYRLFDNWASQSPPGANGLLLLPYFQGERAPHWNIDAKGMYFGLTLQHNIYDMVRALFEASAFSNLDNMIELKKMGLDLQKISISGGPSVSKIWNQIKADVYGVPVQKLNVRFPENQGDAILAGIATKQLSISDAEKWISLEETFSPNLENHATYKRLLNIYRALYQHTKHLMTSIDEIIR